MEIFATPWVFSPPPVASQRAVMPDLAQGQVASEREPAPDRPIVNFARLTFSDGTDIDLDPSDVVVLVGPNNSGKSLALREIESFSHGSSGGMVIRQAAIRRAGSAGEVREFLRKHYRQDESGNWHADRAIFPDAAIETSWGSVRDVGYLCHVFVHRIGTEGRLTEGNEINAIRILTDQAMHPIHLMFVDDSIEERISGYFRNAFGTDLIVFRGGGSSWPLLVGDRPIIRAGEDRISRSYLQRIEENTRPLAQEGDGMRAFATIILHMLARTARSVLLLDEPEAFLHPPQARLVGELFARERPKLTQLFIATHSLDVLHGLLNVAPEHLRIVRLQREGHVNRAKELDKAKAKAIAADPLMKFSSVLGGVFHERVIVCEADSDCMFYNSILNLPQVHGTRQPDVLFVHAGGKQRMAMLEEALRSLDVPVDVIADIDVLNDENVLQRLITALGGDWTAIAAQAAPLRKAIEQRKKAPLSELSNEIRQLLDNAVGPTADLRNKIDQVFRRASPWDAIKLAGRNALPAGTPTNHFDKVLALCRDSGLWIVPVGELEGWCKSVGGHGPKWVQEVLQAHDLEASGALAPARDFVRSLWQARNRF